jgi:hypothetical protein
MVSVCGSEGIKLGDEELEKGVVGLGGVDEIRDEIEKIWRSNRVLHRERIYSERSCSEKRMVKE